MSAALSSDDDIRTAYEADASGLRLRPDVVARPASMEEAVEILRHCGADGIPLTTAGGQTSTTGASISDVGAIMSLRGMNRIIDIDVRARTIRVEPGALVGDIKRAVAGERLLFAPDPTSEDECTIGGAIACNASGARALKFGPVRRHVVGLRVGMADGSVLDLRRSSLEKNTVGYAFVQDPIDWFIGSEGTLGVILEAELALVSLPDLVVGLAVPFRSERDALAFVVAARESSALAARCIEYFDAPALAIARSADDQTSWATEALAMVYVEEEIEDNMDTVLDAWLTVAESHCASDDVRVFEGEAQLRHARRIRHAVPATMNERGAAFRSCGGRKVSTDWAVPYRLLDSAITMARSIADAHGVAQAVTYGHAGNGHPHQNFIARSATELQDIEAVIGETLRAVVSTGGTVAAEHGIGKLKRRWLPLQLSPIQIAVMRAIKTELDPRNILAPGNIL